MAMFQDNPGSWDQNVRILLAIRMKKVLVTTVSEHWMEKSITTFHGLAHLKLTWRSSNIVLDH